jgi:hypothetical protein
MARRLLAKYRWQAAAHEAVFQIVMSFPSPRAETLREHLPARLTRRGFPDFDFEALFALPLAPRIEVEGLIDDLNGRAVAESHSGAA